MKYKITPLIVYLLVSFTVTAQTKVVGECSLQFEIEQLIGETWSKIGQKTVQIKGNQCKTTIITPKLNQTLIFSIQEDSAIILKEIGESKFLQSIVFPPKNIPAIVNMKKVNVDSVIQILGYKCGALQLVSSDNTIYDIIYTSSIIPTVPQFEMVFKDVPGLVLSYSIKTKNGSIIRYLAKQVDLSPITLNQFDINKNEYQIIEK